MSEIPTYFHLNPSPFGKRWGVGNGKRKGDVRRGKVALQRRAMRRAARGSGLPFKRWLAKRAVV